MSKHLVLSINSYDFENRKGERVQGAKVAYINKKPSSREKEIGFPPLLVNVSNPELVSNFEEVPAIYEMDFEQVTGKNNKPEIILANAELISPVDLQELF